MNKYLHTVASVGFLFTLNYDARNQELKKNSWLVTQQTAPDDPETATCQMDGEIIVQLQEVKHLTTECILLTKI